MCYKIITDNPPYYVIFYFFGSICFNARKEFANRVTEFSNKLGILPGGDELQVHHQLQLTMVDGKICSALSEKKLFYLNLSLVYYIAKVIKVPLMSVR